MFPLFMDTRQQPSRVHPRRCHHQCHPTSMPNPFIPFGSTFIDLNDDGCSNDYEEWMNNICPGMIDILHHIIDQRTKNEDGRKEQEIENEGKKSENQEKQEKNKAQKKESKDNSKENDPQSSTKRENAKKHHAARSVTENKHPCTILQDIFNHALFPYQSLEQSYNKKWETRIDCHGFLSSNIKVKIDKNELFIKAFRKQESKDGLRTMTMSKKITLPENIDPKQILCKLSPSGFLHVQAPYVKPTARKENKNKLVVNLLNEIVPGLAEIVPGLAALTFNGGDESQKDVQHKEEVKESTEKRKAEDEEKISLKKTMEENQKEENFGSQNSQIQENKTEIKDSSANDKIDEEKEMSNISSSEPNVSVSDFQVAEGKDVEVKSQDASAAEEVEVSRPEPVQENHKDEEKNTLVMLPARENDCEHSFEAEQADSVHDVINSDDDSVTSEDSFVRISEFNNGQDAENPIGSTVLKESKQQSVSKDETKCDEETEKTVVRLEMPCYDPQSLNVSFDEDSRVLTITASKEETDNKPYSMIKKSITVDDNVDANRLHCFFKDGALTVTAPSKIKSSIQNIPISF